MTGRKESDMTGVPLHGILGQPKSHQADELFLVTDLWFGFGARFV